MSLNGPTLLQLTRNSQINIQVIIISLYRICFYCIILVCGLFQNGDLVPSYYEMILESLDGREDLVTNITVEKNGEMIDMHVEESVPPNSL